FIDYFLNESKDWNEFTTPAMAAALDTLATFSPNQMEWWNKLIGQHNIKIGTSFPDLINSFKYFTEQFILLTGKEDLPEICSLKHVTNMKTGLTRYLDILSKDPTQRPNALDIDTYNLLQKEIAKNKSHVASPALPETKSPIDTSSEEKKATPTFIPKQNRNLKEEEKNDTLTKHFKSDLNAEEIISGIRHLNIDSKKIESDESTVALDKKRSPVDEDEEFPADMDDKVVTHEGPKDLSILEKMSLTEAYFKLNSWGQESSKTIKNLQYFIQSPLTEDMKHILVKSISGPQGNILKEYQDILATQKNIEFPASFPMSLYDLIAAFKKIKEYIQSENDPKINKLIHMRIGENASFDAVVATIRQPIKDMGSDEIRNYAAECRKKIQALTKQLSNKTEEKSEDEAIKKQLIDTKLFYLALLREGLYRSDPQSRFANSTQILSVINETILNEGNSFAQIGTGQGKSLITALIAAMLSAEGKTVDIITSDPHLANEGIKEFHHFYKFFDIPCADRAIESDDYLDDLSITENKPRYTYKKGGINYSDITSMSVFRSRMQLESKNLYFAGPVSAILDEADYIAEFPTTIRYVKSTQQDIRSKHEWVYKVLNDFIDNPEYDTLENVGNKRKYLIEKAIQHINDNIAADVIKKLRDEDKIDVLAEAQIDKWLAAAWNAKYIAETGENKTFKIATKHIAGKNFSVIHHIINNKESEHAQLMDGGQQFLHARMQNKLGTVKHHKFWMEAENPALTSIKSIDFIEYYQDSNQNPGGKIKGHTGFIGDPVQLDIIASRHNIQSTSYPTHQKKQRIDEQGIFLDEKTLDVEINKQVLQMMEENRPTLILCKNAEEARKMAEKIKQLKNSDSKKLFNSKMSQAKINLHTALDKKLMKDKDTDFSQHQMDENETLEFANKNCTITISDASLGRGKDFKPEHSQGLHVILNYLGTQADIEQGIGRAGRQGNKGSSFHGVTLKELPEFNITPNQLPLRSDVINKEDSNRNRKIIAAEFTKARSQQTEKLKKMNLFDEALANISRYFSDRFLEREYENPELDDQAYKNFLSNKDKIWRDTLEKNVDNYTKEELKLCFDLALKNIWDSWPFHGNARDDKDHSFAFEQAKQHIKLPIRGVEIPDFFADLTPAMGVLDFSGIEKTLPTHSESKADTENYIHPEMKAIHADAPTVNQNLIHVSTPILDTTTHLIRKDIRIKQAYQKLKNAMFDFRTKEKIPSNEVLSYAYHTIMEKKSDLGVNLPSTELTRKALTINTKNACLFEAYVLICKLLNIKIDNQTNYLTFEPTDKQRMYVKNYLETSFSISILQSDSNHLTKLKQQAQTYNVFGAFKKKSTLPLNELDLLLIETHHYIRNEITNKNITHFTTDEYQNIINTLKQKQLQVASLSNKTRLADKENNKHLLEIDKREKYQELVKYLIKSNLADLREKRDQNTRSLPLQIKTETKTETKSSSQNQLPISINNTSSTEDNPSLVYLKDYGFTSSHSKVDIERKLIDNSQFVTTS
ncbi:MAG: hypothetical protein JO131_01770, partial [Gammaproteobacteria bacterium]|nr:hypothetical protein [Gammaproteobacteria bacterium]